jgi:YidC/Oxa1 family membrane protein insertase
MDKKHILLGVFFLVAAFGLMTWNSAQEQKAREARRALEEQRRAAEAAQAPAEDPEILPGERTRARPPMMDGDELIVRASPMEDDLLAPIPETAEPERARRAPPTVQHVIETAAMRVFFDVRKGAVDRIELLRYPEVQGQPEPFVLNRDAPFAALALGRETTAGFTPFAPNYEIIDSGPRHVVFSAALRNGLTIEREFRLTDSDEGPDPYSIEHSTRFRNETDQALTLDRLFMVIGTAFPTDADPWGFNLNASFSDGRKYRSIPASRFRDGGFLFFSSRARERDERELPIAWAAVKNQFFTTILTPSVPAAGIIARGVPVSPGPAGDDKVGIIAAVQFAVPTIAPGETETIDLSFYGGPKSFGRLSQMEQGQEDVLQLGWFMGLYLGIIAFTAKALLTLMNWLHFLVPNWGVTIILTTIVIRLLLWPLTAKAAKGSKRMRKLAKPMQELREKYKDDPRRMNEEMMKFWKKHKINPMAGCWPMLVQLPIFIAFFNLIRSASELRFAPFLVISDLSMPDRLITFGDATLPIIGNSLNVLPFLWLVSMWFQMKLMPQPAVDNAQAKIFMFMPFIFFPFTYIFSSGLVLYWTTTNVFSIFQQWIINRSHDEEDDVIEAELEAAEKKKAAAPQGPLISKKKKKKPEDPRSGGLGGLKRK